VMLASFSWSECEMEEFLWHLEWTKDLGTKKIGGWWVKMDTCVFFVFKHTIFRCAVLDIDMLYIDIDRFWQIHE
jgi:hypothetical protein